MSARVWQPKASRIGDAADCESTEVLSIHRARRSLLITAERSLHDGESWAVALITSRHADGRRWSVQVAMRDIDRVIEALGEVREVLRERGERG